MKVEHIGIAVKNLESAKQTYEKLLGTKCYKTEKVEKEQVLTAFFKTGDCKVELLEANSPDSVIAKFIKKKGEGLHHIAFQVEDIEKEMRRLENEGFRVLNEQPARGADNMLVAFIHPKDNHGVLIELCQPAR
jgi:methylmalonyl-CoA/ethylmalonyl-CoA epimerase